jgi:hypothetical protein
VSVVRVRDSYMREQLVIFSRLCLRQGTIGVDSKLLHADALCSGLMSAAQQAASALLWRRSWNRRSRLLLLLLLLLQPHKAILTLPQPQLHPTHDSNQRVQLCHNMLQC